MKDTMDWFVDFALRMKLPYGNSCRKCIIEGRRRDRNQKKCLDATDRGCPYRSKINAFERSYGIPNGKLLRTIKSVWIMEIATKGE